MSKPIQNDAQTSGISVKHKLYLSLFIINAMALVIGFTAWNSFKNSSGTMRLITDKMIPVTESVSEIIVLSAQISSLSPSLIFAKNEDELETTYQTLAYALKKTDRIIDKIKPYKQLNTDFAYVITQTGALRAEIGHLLIDFKEDIALLLSLNRQQQENSKILEEAHSAFIRGTSPLSDDAQFELIIGIENADNFDSALSKQAEELTFILEARAEGNLLAGILEAASHYEDIDALTPLRERYDSTLYRLQKHISLIDKDSAEFELISSAVKTMEELGGESERNIFELQKNRLQKQKDIRDKLTRIEHISYEISQSVNQLAAFVQLNVKDTKKKTERSIEIGTQTIFIVSAGSILFTILFSWFFVRRRVIGRIDKLKSVMLALADKDFTHVITGKTDRDEIGQMARALGTFRERLIENEVLNQDLKESMIEAEEAKNMAIEASRAKSEFLANMSHELRTPLNSIMGLSNILAEDMHDGEEKEMAKTVNKSATSLLAIVNDILDLSKIEAQQMNLEKIGFDFKEVLSSIVETMAPLASQKGVWLNYRYERDKLPFIIGDPVRLGRVLTNLISNAVKYTLEGGVEVIIDYKNAKGKNQIILECSIIDTGIGVPQDKQDAIFQKFTQADDSTTRKFGGTGLGLAITKELVEMMGGEIGMESQKGEGSTFWFKIPFDTTKQLHNEIQEELHKRVAASKGQINISDAHILIAEDHELNQVFIKKLLKRMGCNTFKLVDNGALAFEEYKSGQYDLILMDCHMPEMNGYQATRKIREFENNGPKKVPIIALTADAMLGTREKCIDTGMDDYVSKPIDAQMLKTVLGQWLVISDKPAHKDDAEAVANNQDETECIFDQSALEEYADTDEEMQNFCNIFFAQTEESLESLQEYCVMEEHEKWSDTAHKVKGGSAMIGAVQLQKLAATAQDMTDQSKEEREALLSEMKEAYQAVKDLLSKQIKSD